MQDVFRGAEQGFGGEKRQGLLERVEGEPNELAGAFAGDAELEAGVAQGGFMQGKGGGRFLQGEVQSDRIGKARGQKEGEPLHEIQARGASAADRAAIGGHARQQGAIVGVEFFAGGEGTAQVAEGRGAAGAQFGEDARGQAAGLQRAMA